MCRHIRLLPMCLFDVSFLYCFELIFLIYSAMRRGAAVLFQYHFQCLFSSCLTFFYSCKEPEYAMFRFGSKSRLVFRATQGFWEKIHPTGWRFFFQTCLDLGAT